MKFILKRNGKETDVWLLTPDMVSIIEKNSIKYSALSTLGKQVNKLTFDEVGSFFLLQNLMSNYLGKPEQPIQIESNNATESAILNKFVTTRTDVEQYFIELLQKHNTYFYKVVDECIILMCADKGTKEIDYPSWTLLTGDKFSIALVDVLFTFYGYQDLHFSEPIVTAANEFSLSNAFYALEQGL